MSANVVIVQEADFDGAALTAALREQAGAGVGGIVTFVGYVRDYAPDAPTETLFLEHYPGMCERELEDIAATARARWNLAGTVIVHRVGALSRNAQIVFVAAASAHRGDAFRGCEYIIDALKTRAPFWKSETLAGGKRFWVEQRQADEDRTRSWDEPRPATRTRHEASPAEPVSLACAVLTVSDTRGPGDDTSGNLLAQSLAQAGHQCVRRDIVKDDLYQIRRIISDWIADPAVQVILTSGGTGSHKDTVPEAIGPLLDRQIPGFGELFRQLSYEEIGSSALQSRALAVYANQTLLFCLPGSNNACETAWTRIIREQLDSGHRPCNFATHFKNREDN